MATAQKQIVEWLAARGMAEYADLFVVEKIDLVALFRLTEHDLKELGVALGDRRKILDWAAELNNAANADIAEDIVRPIVAREASSAERRQVTVLFCDLVDSTGLSRKLDPEDLRAVIRAYQETVSQIVRQLDGFVAGFRGDGVLVYFGYPNAHEDDAERAVRAGLDLVAA